MKIFLVFVNLIVLFLSGCTNTSSNHNSSSSYYNTNSSIAPVETEIASFATPILIKESGRQNNIQITCSLLNDTVVKPSDTFSFCNTVGKATPEKGYMEADIFDSDGNIIKGYGGGNCQISSTLYNAVLDCSGLDVTERHAHSRTVDYVEKGKDAAVSYGSVDFKFRNDNNYDIKIKSFASENEVIVKLLKVE